MLGQEQRMEEVVQVPPGSFLARMCEARAACPLT